MKVNVPRADAPANRALIVAEVFGPTFQGEGPSMGRRTSFLRLGGCNLHCSWCDTPYTWDWAGRNGRRYNPSEELQSRTVEEISTAINSHDTQMLVITGGEPLLQQRRLVQLLERLRAQHFRIEVETAGTIAPDPEIVQLVDAFNVSPKLSNSGNVAGKRYVPKVIDLLQQSGIAVWKFVVVTVEDLDEVRDLVRTHQLRPVYIMPEGTNAETLLRRAAEMVDAVLANGWNLTTRLHILLYGNRRGV